MVMKNSDVKGKISKTKWFISTTSLGVFLILIPIILLFIDPILIMVKYYIRLGDGTYTYELMRSKLEGPRIYVSLFNITNAKEYMAGTAEKMKVEEIGPFVYQEYRMNQDLMIDEKTLSMIYTPRIWAELILEESFADPKDVYVTMPSIPMLQGADMMSKYPFFFRNIFNMIASSISSKAIVNITAYDYLWGYPEPLIKLANRAVPGLFYYNSSGIMERLYDVGAKYTIELGTIDKEKFSVKKATKFRKTIHNSDNVIDSVQNFTNAYEGAAFPPGMTSKTPVYIYRHGVCKVFELKMTGLKTTEYGSEAFTYDLSNDTLNDHEICLNNGKWCPDGVKNLAPCYFNFPFVISRGHFLDADPRIIERLEGLKPDRNLHSTELLIDPKIGVTITSKTSVQLNLALGDVGYNAETRRFKDTVIPICLATLKHPKLPSLAVSAFKVLYIYGPNVLLTITIISSLVGLSLLAYSAKSWYEHKAIGKRIYETKIGKIYDYIPLKQ